MSSGESRAGTDPGRAPSETLELATRAMEADPPLAEQLLVQLLVRDPPVDVRARALYLLARRRVQQGRPEAALDDLSSAAFAFETAGEPLQALRTTLGRMHALDELGRHDEAVAAADLALARLDELAAPPEAHEATWLRAALQENRGVALGFAGRTGDALQAARAAHEAWSAVGSPSDRARAAGNLGIELLDSGQPEEALAPIDDAVEQFGAADMLVQQGMARAERARALGHLGRPMQALESLDAAASALADAEAWAERDRARIQRAALLLELGWWHGLADEAAALGEAARRDGRRPDEGRALLILAAARLAADRPGDAADAAEAAEQVFAEVGESHARASALVLLAEALLRNDPASPGARAACEEVIGLADTEGWVLDGLRARLLLGRSDIAHGRAGHAAALAVEVRRTAERLGLLELEAAAEHLLASVHEAGTELDNAVEGLERAVELLEQARSRLTSGALHAGFLASVAPAHDDLVRLLLTRGKPGDERRALEVSGLRQERTLVELRRARATRATTDPAVRQRASLLATHGALRARLDAGPDADRGAAATRETLAELEALAAELRRLDVLATPLATPRAAPAATRLSGAPATPVISYQFVRDELVAFVTLGSALLVLRDLATRDAVDDWSRRIAGHWRRAAQLGLDGRHATALLRDADRDLRTVARAVLDPVLAHLPTLPRLAIVPTGALTTIPFAALPLDDHDAPERLLDRSVVQTGVVRHVDEVAVVLGAAPDATRTLVVGGGTAAPAAVEAEVLAVAAVAGGRALVLRGEQATADALAARAQEAAVLHLAGHGLHDARHPVLSGIRLADRWVSAAELGELDLRCTDVVLSACETARRGADGVEGETVGLVTALLAAGARTVTSSLWPVDDAATAELMPILHAGLARAVAPDQALAAAQQQVRTTHPHPYAWAGFTCQVLAPAELRHAEQDVA